MEEVITKGDRIRVLGAVYSGGNWAKPGDLGTVLWRMSGSENYPPGMLQINLDGTYGFVTLTDGEVEKISSTSTLQASAKKANRPITPREREVLIGVCHGKTGPEIAETMEIKPHGVRLHLNSIYKKTGTRNRTELAIMVYFQGIPDPHFVAHRVDNFIEVM